MMDEADKWRGVDLALAVVIAFVIAREDDATRP